MAPASLSLSAGGSCGSCDATAADTAAAAAKSGGGDGERAGTCCCGSRMPALLAAAINPARDRISLEPTAELNPS